MHLIQRLKIWKELRRLEQRAREEPSPSTFVDLGQVFINLEMVDRALQVAEDGLALFPDSVPLVKLRDFARRTTSKARIDDLRARINRAPTGKLYRELALLHLELGDHGALHATCEEWGVRFPDDAGAWLVLGQARLAAFYRGLAAREGQEAIRCLTRTLQLDPADRRAHQLLAEVYYRLGAVAQAKEHMTVLEKGALDSDLQALRAHIQRAPATTTDVESLLRATEENGALANPPPTAGVPVAREEGINGIRDSLAQLAEMRGIRKATYIRGTRALVKGDIRDGKDSFLRIVRVVAKAGMRFSRRLDYGSFSKGVLQGPFGYVLICSYGEVLAAVECDNTAAIDRVLAELQELVAASLYAAGGAK